VIGLLRFVAAVAFVLICATVAAAGTTGSISGRIVDDSGRPLAGAQMSLFGPAGPYRATSDAHGHYQILSIEPDLYYVSVWRSGNLPWRAAPVEIQADQVTTCNVHLWPSMQITGAMSPAGNSVVPCSFIAKLRTRGDR
jgi:hypothetical protein